MRAGGLVDEVRRLVGPAGPGLSRTARQAIGYREVLEHLDDAGPTLDEVLERAVRRTRSFARRQRMWFRRDPRIRRPVGTLTWERDGLRHLAPEVQLLYKAKEPRARDEVFG